MSSKDKEYTLKYKLREVTIPLTRISVTGHSMKTRTKTKTTKCPVVSQKNSGNGSAISGMATQKQKKRKDVPEGWEEWFSDEDDTEDNGDGHVEVIEISDNGSAEGEGEPLRGFVLEELPDWLWKDNENSTEKVKEQDIEDNGQEASQDKKSDGHDEVIVISDDRSTEGEGETSRASNKPGGTNSAKKRKQPYRKTRSVKNMTKKQKRM